VHRELSFIYQLWEHDCSVDSIRARAAALKEQVARLSAQIEEHTEAVRLISAEEEQFGENQAVTQRELDRYVIRRDRSKELLRGGHSLDFGTVQKQFDQCSERVDELELEVLQLMEDRDRCRAEIDAANEARECAEEARVAAHQQWVSQGSVLRGDLEQIWPIRQAAASELTREQLLRYEDFRKREMEPLARITGKTCGACHVVVASHLRMEVGNGKRLHACRGCGRWLLPPEESDELDEEASDA